MENLRSVALHDAEHVDELNGRSEGTGMTHRAAAESAYLLACNDQEDVARLGLRLLEDLAVKECYLAKLCMMYVYDFGGLVDPDPKVARMWADQARAMHSTLSDPDDLHDAGQKCKWDRHRFLASDQDALALWEKSASLGNGAALFAICDATHYDADRPKDWTERLTAAAHLGSTQAIVELAGQDGVRGTEQELIWLRAAVALESLRAKEMLECSE
ncbi:hypothetical protein [Massilia soli]|uniref:Sel1 repeat family protein n=1 Tax=Massilia soli TaxID=2792854 RepID=A0ABS7SR39_9BURK|nr:hypothetical protein [Massilia soli]MBZ2208397.1 hypothetical protein [Massilia soli]